MIENPKNFEEQFKNFLEYLAGELKGLSKTVKSFDGLLNAEFGDVESGSAGEDVKAFYEKLEQLVQNTVSQTFNTFVENQGNLEEATPEVQQFFNNMEKVVQETVKEYFFNSVEEGGLGGSDSLTNEQKKQFIENLGIFDSEDFKTAVQNVIDEALTQASVAFATTEEVTEGTATDKAIDPKTLKEAGIVKTEYATSEDVSTGTEENKAINPKVLKEILESNNSTLKLEITSEVTSSLPEAAEGQKGTIELASSEEVQAGTDETKAVTPKTLKETLDALVPNVQDATTEVKGVVELATDDEALTATDGTKALVASNIKQFIDKGQIGTAKLLASQDLNELKANGMYWVDASNTNGPVKTTAGAVENVSSSDDGSTDIIQIFTTADEDPRGYVRQFVQSSGIWTEWKTSDGTSEDASDKYILKSGNTGTVYAYQANTDDGIGANTEATINKDSAEYLTLPETVTTLTIGDENPNNNSWTKVIALSKAITVTLGTGWVWAGGEAPELAAGIIVATACGAQCIASFTSTTTA